MFRGKMKNKFIRFRDFKREVCILIDSIIGWSDDGISVRIFVNDGSYWDLTGIGSVEFKRIWKTLDGHEIV